MRDLDRGLGGGHYQETVDYIQSKVPENSSSLPPSSGGFDAQQAWQDLRAGSSQTDPRRFGGPLPGTPRATNSSSRSAEYPPADISRYVPTVDENALKVAELRKPSPNRATLNVQSKHDYLNLIRLVHKEVDRDTLIQKITSLYERYSRRANEGANSNPDQSAGNRC